MLSLSLLELPEPLPTQLSGMVLDSPKSHILMLQSSSTSMLDVLMSRCMMLAEWRNFRAQVMLYKMREMWFGVRHLELWLRTFFRSWPKHSITINKLSLPSKVQECMSISSTKKGDIEESFRRSCISLIVLTQLYSFSSTCSINFIATSRPVLRQLALTTWP